MNLTRRRGAIAFFITLGVCLTGLAVALNVTWVHINGRRIALDVLGVILFTILIAGVVLNTVFLVREIRRNERQDSFLNAVTHELKTPIASIRLYLDTLQRHPVDELQRQHLQRRSRVELKTLVSECIAITLSRHHLPAEAIQLDDVPGDVRLFVSANPEDLRTAVLNLLDNAVKYSPQGVHVKCKLSIERYTWAVLSITDTGLGIQARDLRRIFKRFYRAATSDRVKI